MVSLQAQAPSVPTAIVDQLEVAEAGSRELDALIWAHFRPERIKVTGWNQPYADDSGRTQVEFFLLPKRTRTVTGGRGLFPHAEPVTTSLDAALALAERVLPGWRWVVDIPGGPNAGVQAFDESGLTDDEWTWAKSAPLALCASILKACQP